MSRDWLLVSEVFRSHQGEGPSTGQLATFIRLGGCGLTCSWCDTPYTWVFTERQRKLHHLETIFDPKQELKRHGAKKLAEEIRYHPEELIVISGGEPMLQQEGIASFISAVNEEPCNKRYEVETAGVVAPVSAYLTSEAQIRYNVSLKLESSGNPKSKRRVPSAIKAFVAADSIFKFVVTRDALQQDIDEIGELSSKFDISPERIWLMPEGTTQLDQVAGAQRLAPIALSWGVNFSTRLHVLAYGDTRGT